MAEPAVMPDSLPGEDNVSPQEHGDTQDSEDIAELDDQHHKSSISPSRELHASLPDRSPNTIVNKSPQSNQSFLHQVLLPRRSLQAAASLGITSSSPAPEILSHAPGHASLPNNLASPAKPNEFPLLYFPPPIPGVNGNEVIYESSTKRAKKQKYLFKKKDPSRDYDNHSSAHLTSSYQILAEIYTIEGEEVGLREFSHQLKDGKMCTRVMDIYRSHRIPGSCMPLSYSNVYPKAPPMSTPTKIDVSPYRHPRICASKKAAAAITTSVPELSSVDPPSIAPAGKTPPLNPLSTTLKWSSSKRKFDVFTSGTGTPPPRSSKMLKASADHDMDSSPDDVSSLSVDDESDTVPRKTYRYSLALWNRRLDGPLRPAQKQQDDLAGESDDSMDKDELSTDETLSDEEDDLDVEDIE